MLLLVPLLLQLQGAPFAPHPPEPTPAPRAVKTVAVLNFDNNSGRADYDAMGRGIAAMMITDLSASPLLRVVERERLHDVLTEQRLQHSQFFDSTTAVRAGRLVGAEYIVTGSLAAATPELRLDTRVIRVETGEIVKTARVSGREDNFFELEQKLADRLLKDLDIALSPEDSATLRRRQEENRALGFTTFMAFSNALYAMDNGDYVTAGERLIPVVRQAPDSRVVQAAYQEAKHRSTVSAKQRAKEKARSGLRGLLKKP